MKKMLRYKKFINTVLCLFCQEGEDELEGGGTMVRGDNDTMKSQGNLQFLS